MDVFLILNLGMYYGIAWAPHSKMGILIDKLTCMAARLKILHPPEVGCKFQTTYDKHPYDSGQLELQHRTHY